MHLSREYWREKYRCTIDLLFDRFGLACFANENKNCQLPYSWFQTIQTEGQLYILPSLVFLDLSMASWTQPQLAAHILWLIGSSPSLLGATNGGSWQAWQTLRKVGLSQDWKHLTTASLYQIILHRLVYTAFDILEVISLNFWPVYDFVHCIPFVM